MCAELPALEVLIELLRLPGSDVQDLLYLLGWVLVLLFRPPPFRLPSPPHPLSIFRRCRCPSSSSGSAQEAVLQVVGHDSRVKSVCNV